MCPRFANNGTVACANNKNHRAEEVKEAVARFVGGELLMSRERLETHIPGPLYNPLVLYLAHLRAKV